MVGNFPDLDAATGKISVEDVYKMVLGKSFFTTLNTAPDIENDLTIDLMIKHFTKGSVISLSSAHSEEFINKKTGKYSPNHNDFNFIQIS